MAQQIFQQPNRRSRDEDPYAEDQGWSPKKGIGPGRASNASTNVGSTLDNIDSALADYESSNPTTGSAIDPKGTNSAAELKAKEEKPANNDLGIARSADDDNDEDEKPTKFKWLRDPKTRKRGGIIGAIMTLFTGGLLGFNLAAGPLHLMYDAEILGHSFNKTQSDTQNRDSHMFRDITAFAKGDARYTRIGIVGGYVMGRTLNALNDAGVTFTGVDNITGAPTGVEVDKAKVEANFPETRDMSGPEFDSWLNDKFSTTGFSGGKLDITGFNSSAISDLVTNVNIAMTGNTKLVSGVKMRTLKNFWGLKGLFHPITKAMIDKARAAATAAEKKNAAESSDEATQQADITTVEATNDANVATLEAPGVDAFDEAKAEADGVGGKIVSNVGSVLGYDWITGCTLRDTGKAIVTVDRTLIVLPAAVAAATVIADAAQMKYGGPDMNIGLMGAQVTSREDSAGNGLESSTPFRALANPDSLSKMTKGSNGEYPNDLSDNYKQAFGSQAFASNMVNVGNFLLDFIPLTYLSKVPVIGGIANPCGLASGIAVGAGGLLWNGFEIAFAPESGGASVAFTWVIEQGVQDTVKAALGSKLLGFISNQIINAKTAPKVTSAVLKGVTGSGLITYGARALANESAISSGGVAVDNNTSTNVGPVGLAEQKQFESESTFARLFDFQDYRSLTGQLAMDIGPNTLGDVTGLLGNMFNIGHTLTASFASMTPSVSADATTSWSGNYDWGFPQYGIPDSLLNSKQYQHPGATAKTPGSDENTGMLLSSMCTDTSGNISAQGGPCGGSDGYSARLMACFGNTLSYGYESDVNASVWDVTPDSNADVNPNSDAYQNANCGGTSDPMWANLIMLTNDNNDMDGIDCVQGLSATSAQSCKDVGSDPGATQGTYQAENVN